MLERMFFFLYPKFYGVKKGAAVTRSLPCFLHHFSISIRIIREQGEEVEETIGSEGPLLSLYQSNEYVFQNVYCFKTF